MSDKPMGNGIQHTPAQVRRNLYILILLTVILVSFYPALFGSTYKGSADFHAAIEMTGALLGLIAGFSMVMRFYTLGNRLHLFIGLAFFVNGAEDLVHGLLSFESVLGITDMPGSTLMQFIPGTYVTGRIMMALLLLLAPYANRWTKRSLNPKAETLRFSFAAIIITIFATVAAFKIPLPQFIYPGHVISRPVDFISAVILLLALVSIFHEYHRTRDILLWWISLSIAINAVGQFMMSFSKILYDLFFDMAHFYKIVGYAIPLLGFSLYQISVIAQRNRTEKARLKLEEQLRQSQKMEALGSLAGGIAHDFNNILGAIIGYTELTIDDIPKGSAAEHNLHQVMSAGNRAKETVQQILAFSREEETERKPVLLSEMVNEALHLLRSILPATINIRANIEEKGTPVSANPTMIHQVIMNICSNAAHAMKEKGGTLEITLTEIDIGPYVISAKKSNPAGTSASLSPTPVTVWKREF